MNQVKIQELHASNKPHANVPHNSHFSTAALSSTSTLSDLLMHIAEHPAPFPWRRIAEDAP